MLILTAVVGVLVLALVAGVMLLGGSDPRRSAADGKREAKADPRLLAPYRLALADLVTVPGLRYKDDSPGGLMEREVTVTSAGSRFGSSGFGREELDREFLSVGGKTFVRWRLDPAAKNGEKKPSRCVQYTIPLRANSLITARALATVEVERLVEKAGKERKGAGPCSATRDFRSGFLAPDASPRGEVQQSRTDVVPHVDRTAAGKKDPLNFGSNYTGRLDRFEIGGTTDFEIHVYKNGKEIGIFGSDGWFAKHGKSADVKVPRETYNLLKGLAVGEMRREGRIGPKGTENIKGDSWKRDRITGGC